MNEIKLKPWIVVTYDLYYPEPGLDNIYGFFDTREEAELVAEKLRTRHYREFIYVDNILEKQEIINDQRQ